MVPSAQVVSVTSRGVRLYPPSWIDRLCAAVDRSRVPGWVVYSALALICIPVFVAADVLSRAFPLTQILPFHAFLAALPTLTIWFIDYLDRTAERALDRAIPVLKASPEEIELLRYELTTMPARTVLVLTILGPLSIPVIMAAIFALDPSDTFLSVLGLTRTTPSLAAFVLFIGLSYATGLVFLYHAVRQLRLVSRIYERHVVVDLSSLGPLYSFSRVSALTAVALQLQAVLWIVTNPAAGGAFLPIVS